jgi:peptide/nickel transport system substrate-binding protein
MSATPILRLTHHQGESDKFAKFDQLILLIESDRWERYEVQEMSDYWSRWHRRQLSRRGFVASAGAAGLGAAALGLVGCGDDDSDDGSDGGGGQTSTGTTESGEVEYPTSGWGDFTLEEMKTIYHPTKLKLRPGHKSEPPAGGTVVQALLAPVDYDPAGPSAARLAADCYAHNNLLDFPAHDLVENPNILTVESTLAEGMPEQPDDLTYVFKIRKGVKFHDVAPVNGRDMTVDDIVYSFEQYRKAPHQSPNLADVDSIEATDDSTVTFKMKAPAAYLIRAMAIPNHWIFSPEQHSSGEGLAQKPIGTGPFVHESHEPQGNWRFVKNPNYWRKDEFTGKQLPYLDAIEGVYYPTSAQQVAAYRSKQIDLYPPTNFQEWADIMETDPDSITTVTTPPASFQPYMLLRLNEGPFTDPRVRRGLSMLVDRDALIDSLAYGMAAYGLGVDFNYYGREYPFDAPDLGPWYQYNPTEAKKLLDASGVDLEFDFLMTQYFGINFDTWNAVANMWTQEGVKTNIEAPQDGARIIDQYYGLKYRHIVGVAAIGPGLDPDIYTYAALNSESTKNYSVFKDAKMDDLTTKQRQTLDEEERNAILEEWLQYDLDLVTRIWTMLPYRLRVARPNIYNVTDQSNAWIPGWASHGIEYGFKLA